MKPEDWIELPEARNLHVADDTHYWLFNRETNETALAYCSVNGALHLTNQTDSISRTDQRHWTHIMGCPWPKFKPPSRRDEFMAAVDVLAGFVREQAASTDPTLAAALTMVRAGAPK